ncbi:Type-1 angiotensin II receptor-associated protein [Trinorchestia longiramus]|nr:Type-1 angiotensin II receptor-associated protein [Trinorchestia longiramus]
MALRIPYAPLKVVFCIHLVLIVWASESMWLPTSYLGYNGLLLLTIMWTIHSRDSEEGPFMGIMVNGVSVLLDIVTLSVFWPNFSSSGLGWFGSLCTVGNLLMRPITSYMLYKILVDRAATYGNFSLPAGLDTLFQGTGLGHARSPYEDIDQPTNPQTLTPHSPDPSMPPQTPYPPKPQDPLGFNSA